MENCCIWKTHHQSSLWIALSLSSQIVEGDSATVISWVNNKERSSWKFDNWMCKIMDNANELGCSLLDSLFSKLSRKSVSQARSRAYDLLCWRFPFHLSVQFFCSYLYAGFYEGGLVFVVLSLDYILPSVAHLWRIAHASYIYQLFDEWKYLFLIKKKKAMFKNMFVLKYCFEYLLVGYTLLIHYFNYLGFWING